MSILLFSFLTKFKNTEYEPIFWTTVSKIIPINYIISQNDWKITSKILSTNKNGGLCGNKSMIP